MHPLALIRTRIHFGQFNNLLTVLQAKAHRGALRLVLGMAHA